MRPVELACPRGIDPGEWRELHAAVRGHLEEASRRPVMDDCQNHAELFVERDQLAYQRLVVDCQTRAMDVRQWPCLAEVESLRRKDRDGARARQVIPLVEVVQ